MARLTREQLILFNELHDSRTEDYKTLSKKSYRGFWSSIKDKYPESAHFVYELLQNADDAEATEVHITINRDEMLFKHNGKKHFDITPEDASPVGDINSITGVGDSSKTDLQNKIGKFGVGFKAVFQYTNTPEIYDDIFKFKIDNYIIPTLLEKDRSERKKGETLFVFPFKDPEKAFNEIKEKIDKLQNPILFLRNLNLIVIRVRRSGWKRYDEISYKKTLKERLTYNDGIILERYILNEPLKTSSVFLFSQSVEVTDEGTVSSHYISVGFFYNEIEKRLITDIKRNIFCFFPTIETFNTCFVSHAPFLLTDNRQNLMPGELLNQDLVNLLGELAAQSVLHLRDYGKKTKQLLIDENIVDIIPSYHKGYFEEYDKVFETPIKKAFDEIIDNEAIFLSRGGKYLSKEEAYLGSPHELVELLNKKQLNELHETDNDVDFLKWELSLKLSKENWNYSKKFYEYTSERFAKDITADFMSKQDMKWIIRMYNFLRTAAPKLWKVTSDERTKDYKLLPFRTAPIIKSQKGDWVAPYLEDKSRNVYLPLKKDAESSYNFVDEEYLKNEFAKRFFDELEIKEPDEFDYINNTILERYRGEGIDGDQVSRNEDLIVIISYWKKITGTSKEDALLSLLRNDLYLKRKDGYYDLPKNLHFPKDGLNEYLKGSELHQFDKEFYHRVFEKFGSVATDFFIRLRIRTLPRIFNLNQGYWSYSDRIKSQISLDFESISWIKFNDYELENFEFIIKKGRMTKAMSIYIWNTLLPELRFLLMNIWMLFIRENMLEKKIVFRAIRLLKINWLV